MPSLRPWYEETEPREEIRQGRSFNPDEFAIHLEQVVTNKGTLDYRDPEKFFSRNVFTRALKEHARLVLRRLAGETTDTTPVMSLVTQFGGGKTHTLTALYHLANAGTEASRYKDIPELLQFAGLTECPGAKVGVFVGNAWDPQPGLETPWLSLANRIAGKEGLEALGESAKTTAPGTEALARLFEAAGGPVLILCDEVLNFCNRYENLTDGFYAFIQNLTVAMTGTTRGAAVISLPRSQVEMTDRDIVWQARITKVVSRVAKPLIINDEAEVAEVIRRRLFENLGSEKHRRQVAKLYADWCFQWRSLLPPEWTAVDSAETDSKAREYLQKRFEDCYPFHPAALSVFQRKWQALPQYQQTRGTLAMLAQWVSWAFDKKHKDNDPDLLLTLGTAPLHEPTFRNAVLTQLGENRLNSAIDADITGTVAHAKALDADAKGPLKGIHRRVGTAILFESSGGQTDKVAHLPDIRFALTSPQPPIDTTSIDNAVQALEKRAFFIRKEGHDGYKIFYQATLRKVVNDRRASLDFDADVKPLMEQEVREVFRKGATLGVEPFPKSSADIGNSPRLQLVVADPTWEWTGNGEVKKQVTEWIQKRGNADRDYPAAVIWCVKKPGRELREKAETFLAWKRVQDDANKGLLGSEIPAKEISEITSKLKNAHMDLVDEVWASYRHVVVLDRNQPGSIHDEDLGGGTGSNSVSMCARVIQTLKSAALLNETVGIGYLDRSWPVALRDSGEWPLSGLRKAFLDGSFTRLIDPDAALLAAIRDGVARGEAGLGYGRQPDGSYSRVWFKEDVSPSEITFSNDLYLLRKEKASALTTQPKPDEAKPERPPSGGGGPTPPVIDKEDDTDEDEGESTDDTPKQLKLDLRGSIPFNSWNMVGRQLLSKLKANAQPRDNGEADIEIELAIRCGVDPKRGEILTGEVRQVLEDLGLGESMKVQRRSGE